MPSDIQSILHPAGIQAARIGALWWLMLWVCTGVYLAVMAGLLFAVVRGRSGRATATPDTTLGRRVLAMVALSTVMLVGLLIASALTGRAIATSGGVDALAIRITGNQWWWTIEYLDADPSLRVTTANEMHLPVGRPIVVTLAASDVIHSFWVPRLHGKTDLVPGRQNTTWLRVDAPGIYRGQCAEYCGVQHAHMALSVIAEPSHEFERWLAAQRQNALPPSTPEQVRGLQVVERSACALCHTIRGTAAQARTAPDLTHFGSRSTIAAGTVPNTPGYLAAWIADPQHLKPGSRMPPTGLSGADLQDVVSYLESLR